MFKKKRQTDDVGTHSKGLAFTEVLLVRFGHSFAALFYLLGRCHDYDS
jgi:hypothetical protein